MDLQLRGRTCLITGASAGIGSGIARVLASEGVRLAMTARRADRLEKLAAEILVAVLSLPLARYITGAVIPVDGGMHFFAH